MTTTAVIDTTRHDHDVPVDYPVAGLGLLERTLRLADVVGCDRAVLVCRAERRDRIDEMRTDFERRDDYALATELRVLDAGTSPDAAVDELVHTVGAQLYLDSRCVYRRTAVERCLAPPERADRLRTVPLDNAGGLAAAASDAVETVEFCTDLSDDDWALAIDGPEAARRAEDRIWQDCIKPIDGPVSRHLNRHVSLAISRWLAPTRVTPNQMSAVTFAFGLAAAAAVATGGYLWFLLGALLYQLSSILDGVDGELARARYEFSVTGEWVDTLSDNVKDILFYLGLGYGAAQTVPGLLGIAGADLWMWLGGLAAVGKFLSLAGYATWLIPRGRGCVLIFDWGDDGDGEPADGLVARAFSSLEVFGKNDVVIFTAFVLALVGGLHWFLALMAVAQPVAAAGIAARLASPDVDIVPERAGGSERMKAEG